MKQPWLMPALALMAAAVLVDAAPPERLFHQAAEAYDAGSFGEARTLYQRLVEEGWTDPAVLFNLGNSAFRQGDLGAAVLAYRRAWRQRPRDPDILANLRFAWDTAATPHPVAPWARRAAETLSLHEWTALAALSLLAGCLTIALHLRWRQARALAWVGIGLLLLCAVSMLGRLHWEWDRLQPEAVVMHSGVSARFAPLPDSTARMDLPAGSLVRIQDRNANWLRVRLNQQTGWIPEDTVTLVHPMAASAE